MTRLVGVTLNHGAAGGPTVSVLVLVSGGETGATLKEIEAEVEASEQAVMGALRPFLNNSTHVQVDAYGPLVQPVGLGKEGE